MRGRIRIVRVGEMPSSIAFYYEPSSFLRLVRDGWCDGDGPRYAGKFTHSTVEQQLFE
jgi:hypothetical protein